MAEINFGYAHASCWLSVEFQMTQPPSVPTPPSQPDGTPVPPAFDPAAAAPKKKSGALKIVLIVLAVVLVLCCGGGIATWLVVKDDVKEAVDTVQEASTTRVVEPETLGGRSKIDDADLASIAVDMADALKVEMPNSTSHAAGFYGDLAQEDMVMFAAVSGLVTDQARLLDTNVEDAATNMGLTNVTTVDPGPLGGQAKCGDGDDGDGGKLGICIWTDAGSLGIIIDYYRSGAETGVDLPAMRADIEQKS
ncbi:hypothetical protein [Melissospora conviva]|uniref:hypothetical protein n=1 Tax=Melissospora conviva TaxID=3388432 RepID=UPI003C25E08F